jgi:hypothetical protein
VRVCVVVPAGWWPGLECDALLEVLVAGGQHRAEGNAAAAAAVKAPGGGGGDDSGGRDQSGGAPTTAAATAATTPSPCDVRASLRTLPPGVAVVDAAPYRGRATALLLGPVSAASVGASDGAAAAADEGSGGGGGGRQLVLLPAASPEPLDPPTTAGPHNGAPCLLAACLRAPSTHMQTVGLAGLRSRALSASAPPLLPPAAVSAPRGVAALFDVCGKGRMVDLEEDEEDGEEEEEEGEEEDGMQ